MGIKCVKYIHSTYFTLTWGWWTFDVTIANLWSKDMFFVFTCMYTYEMLVTPPKFYIAPWKMGRVEADFPFEMVPF